MAQWLSGSAAFFLTCNCKGKGVVRINTRKGVYLAKSQGKRGVKCSSCRDRGQKSNLSYRHAKLEAVKVKKKKKLGMFQACSLFSYILYSQEREREKLIPLFSFSLQQKCSRENKERNGEKRCRKGRSQEEYDVGQAPSSDWSRGQSWRVNYTSCSSSFLRDLYFHTPEPTSSMDPVGRRTQTPREFLFRLCDGVQSSPHSPREILWMKSQL